ncbi:CHAT domain-containing protein [Actinophytocola gossypii]|uniref:CHAT domain-containing protein n=1 Tax=Actinophytocola gossypii TaxID=2812003 RepID=A0ABT2JJB1_9PSEU|nr:CHAT domain-containing protein [Actinophytocola gossypii]MCT2587962.1 CHAT domain-containing protein [Actinophytocola gossypii]
MLASPWTWGILLAVVLAWQLYRNYLATRLGVRPTTQNLEQVKQHMLILQQANQLVIQGEIGQAMIVLDELAQRPEIEETPAVAAQVDFHRTQVATTLGRFDVALASAERGVRFYREVYQRWRTPRNASALGEMLQQVAKIHVRQGNSAAAIEVLEEVRSVSRRGAFRQTAVRTEIELARLYIDTGDYPRGADHARKGHELAAKWNMRDHAVDALHHQAIGVGGAGDLVGCRRLLDAAEAAMHPDTPVGLQADNLKVRFGLAIDEGNLREQVDTGTKFLRIAGALKAARGWRQHQADAHASFADVEQQTLEAALTLAADDPEALTMYVTALGMLRESDIANLLRTGILDTGSDARQGLPGVVAELLVQLARAEDPETPTIGSSAHLYEKLENVASAQFRQMMQGPVGKPRKRIVPGHHFVQTRLVADDGKIVIYGSWEPPGRTPVPYRCELPSDLAQSLLEVTGHADRKRPAGADEPEAVRASTKGWQRSVRRRALADWNQPWRSLTPLLLPPALVDLVAATPPNAADDEIPLIMFSPDSLLWALPWSALRIDDTGTTLGDRAATALLPSNSVLNPEPAPQPAARGVLSYLHGVDEAGLELERTSLRTCWPAQVDEAIDADTLVRELGTANKYSMLTMSVHGDDRPGLAHSLLLNPERRTRLSAARMMGLRFPRTVVVGACFSGNLDRRIGTDPIGIPSVMLCRGASTVIGGTFPLPDGASTGHATATILEHLYIQLARGARAPWALRRAQQRWRAEHDTSPLSWAGLTAMSNGDLV